MKYKAVYYRYHNRQEAEFDTAAEAAQFLLDGEYDGELSYESVIGPDGVVLADHEGIGHESLEKLIMESDQSPSPSSGEQPTTVESELLDLPTGDALPQGGQVRLRDMLRPEAVQMILKLIAEERRQAKIEAIDECLLIIGPDEPLKDWLEKADPAAIRNLHRAALRDFITPLRGENNE